MFDFTPIIQKQKKLSELTTNLTVEDLRASTPRPATGERLLFTLAFTLLLWLRCMMRLESNPTNLQEQTRCRG